MRTAPMVPAAYVIAVAVVVLHTPRLPSWVELLVLATIGTGGLAIARSTIPRYLALGVIAAVITLVPALRWQTHLLPETCERRSLEVRGTVQGLPRPFEGGRSEGITLQVIIDDLDDNECTGPRLARISVYGGRHGEASPTADVLPQIAPGDRLVLRARLRRPRGTVNPSARRGELPALLNGLHAIGSASKILLHETVVRPAAMALLHRLRDRVSSALRYQRSADVGALLSALAVGDQRFMSPAHWERLRRFGLTHLLVISGLHISLAAIPGWLMGRLLSLPIVLMAPGAASARLRSLLTSAMALMFAGAYAVLAGLTLPTQRALIMVTLVLAPPLFSRRVDRGRVLAQVMVLLWIIDPVSVLGASFSLSVGAVALLLWVSLWLGGAPAWRGAVNMQGFMILAMIPLGVFWFQSTPSVAALLNLIAVPVVTWVLVPLLLSAGLAEVICPAFVGMLVSAAAGLVNAAWSILGQVEKLGAVASATPLAPPVAALLPLLVAVLLLPLPPMRHRLLLITGLLIPMLLPLRPIDDEARITVFDVGQGTALLLEAEGKRILYDTGGLSGAGRPRALSTVQPYFLARRIAALDLLVISHEDADHSGGEALLRNGAPPRAVRRGRMSDAAASGPGELLCRPGELIRLAPDIELRLLSGAFRHDTDNNSSCVVMVSFRGYRLLLPGDIDRHRERELVAYWGRELRADLLLAGHHGSGSSSGRLWLRTVAPAQVIVSAAWANAFGHPAQRVVADVAAQGAALLSTAEGGALLFTVDRNGQLRCARSRHRLSPFWRHGGAARDCSRSESVARSERYSSPRRGIIPRDS